MRRTSGLLRRLHPDHSRIARAGFWLLLFTLIAKLAGAGKEIAVAWRYGRGPEVDAYNLALTLSTWLPVTLISVTTVVLVPALARLASEPGQGDRRFLRELNGAATAVGVVLAVGTFTAAHPLVQFVAAGLPETTRQLGVEMMRSFAPLALLTVLSGVFIARMQALHNHRYAISEALPALTVVILLLAWQTDSSLPLVAGTLLGFAWQTVWLLRRLRGADDAAGLALGFRSAQWPGLWRATLLMGVGQFAMSLAQPVDQWFAATLGTGEIATLGYANRVIALGTALGAVVISRATLPVFAEGMARGEPVRVRRHALSWTWLMLAVGVVGAVFVWSIATPLIALLFERGAFSAEDTRAVADALRWGIWQLPPYLAGLVLVSLLAAQRRYHVIGAIASVNIVFKLTGNMLLVEPMGLSGILAATVAMYALSALLCWVAVMHRGGQDNEGIR